MLTLQDLSDTEDISKSFKRNTPTLLLSHAKEMVKDLFNNIEVDLRSNTSQTLSSAKQTVELVLDNRKVTNFISNFEEYDACTFSHSIGCAVYTAVLSSALRLSKIEANQNVCGALLHDVGKYFIPRKILQKPAKLSPEEFNIIKKHPDIGSHILKNEKVTTDIQAMVRHHHERWDGSGYPLGQKREQIVQSARIIAIADVYEALTSNRPYRSALLPAQACSFLEDKLDIHFDSYMGQIFIKTILPQNYREI